jgi:hypothetical protein
MSDGDDESLPAAVDPETAGESYPQGVERRKVMRAESLRKLNEEARKSLITAARGIE